ncbi:MAG TPA: DUF2905 family protein [Acidimicrobiia bacterium]|jgi:hypothetical protein
MDIGRTLVIVGLVIAVVGGLIWLLGGLGLGRLPGDIDWRRGNLRVYVPIASCLLLSLVGTLVLNLFFRR